jgi:signal transduction histidine kinase
MTWLTDRFKGDDSKNQLKAMRKNSASSDVVRSLEREIIRLRSLLRMTAELNSTLNYERVLEMTLDLAMSVVTEKRDSSLVGILMLFTQDQLYIAAGRGLTHADLRVEFPGRDGLLERALSTGDISLIEDPANDPELRHLVAMHNTRSAVCIPLVVALEVYGVLLFAHPHPNFFNVAVMELLETVAQHATVSLQNARLYRDLEQEKERIGEIQEEARKKLARDLHDGPTQSVGAIAMRVNFARRLIARDQQAASDELYKIEELARRTTKEIRQMLFTLRPLVIESEGLVAALNQLADKMKENHDQKVVVEASPDVVEDLEVGKQGVIFFIAEEAVNNARKHSGADTIWVRLASRKDLLYLEIEDNGSGFDVKKIQDNYDQRGSLGLINLQERAELVNGLLQIQSQPGKGTRVVATIPLTIESAERMHRPGFNG